MSCLKAATKQCAAASKGEGVNFVQIYRNSGLFAAIFAYIIKVNLYNKEFLTINIEKTDKNAKKPLHGQRL